MLMRRTILVCLIPLLLVTGILSWRYQSGVAQSGIVYNALPAFYQDEQVFYYIFENGTPVLDDGRRVAVVDQYRLVYADGEPVPEQHDIIPTGGPFSDTYSDLREIVEVIVPADYEANTFTSVEALEADGLLLDDNINRTGQTINAPIALVGAVLQGRDRAPEVVWENGQQQTVFNFGETPAEAAPIYVLVTDEVGTRLPGVSSVIEQMHDDPGYSDFWQMFEVRVPPDTDPNSIRSFEDIVALGLPIQETDTVINCPAIRLEHMAQAYYDDNLYHITQVERADQPVEDALSALYTLESQPEPVLQHAPGDAGYTGFCQPNLVQLQQNLPNPLTNAVFFEENTNVEVSLNSSVNSCAVLAPVLLVEQD